MIVRWKFERTSFDISSVTRVEASFNETADKTGTRRGKTTVRSMSIADAAAGAGMGETLRRMPINIKYSQYNITKNNRRKLPADRIRTDAPRSSDISFPSTDTEVASLDVAMFTRQVEYEKFDRMS